MKTEYEVKYYTHNTYEENVNEAFYSFLVTPCTDDSQIVRNVTYHNSLGAQEFHHQNSFGYQVTSLYTAQPFRDLEFEMTALVEKSTPLQPYGTPLTIEEEQAELCAYDFYIDHHLYLSTGHYTHIEEAYRSKLLFRQQQQSVLEYLTQLNEFIHQSLEFDPEPTHVHTTVSEVLQLKRGVCQDYTHLFIGIARLNKIPCRYVSGYLNQGLNLSGFAVMHAWVEAYVPGLGWCGFDPTNNIQVDVNHIKAAHGADYSDCSPIKGVLKTIGGNKTNFGVRVTPQLKGEVTQQQTMFSN